MTSFMKFKQKMTKKTKQVQNKEIGKKQSKHDKFHEI